MGIDEDIKDIEDELGRTKYNKATQKHIGLLKAKMARLREAGEKKSGGGFRGLGYGVKKAGDATVLLVGVPSVGKSTIINTITNAHSKTAEYEFTTLGVIPGILEYNGAKIQILDIPGIISAAASGKGFGKKVLAVVRVADLVLIILGGESVERALSQLALLKTELYDAGFRIGKKPPDVVIVKKNSGGISVQTSAKHTKLSKEEVVSILNEFSIYNADIIIREDIDTDQLIDCMVKSRVYVPYIVCVNKSDLLSAAEREKIKKLSGEQPVFISSLKKDNIPQFKQQIWQKLGLIRVYMKRIGKDPDRKEPMVVRQGETVLDVCEKIHKEFAKNFDYARIWGSGVFAGQKVGPNHKLKDEDCLELHFE